MKALADIQEQIEIAVEDIGVAGGAVILAGDAILREPPPLHDPILDGLFDLHALVEIVGPSKTRKSFAVLQLALSLAAGRAVFGFDVRRSFSVLVADMELSEADIRRRTWRMGRALRIGPDDISDRLRILPLAGVDDPCAIIETAAEGIDIVVCDPLYALCDGGEKIEDLREPLRWLRRLAVGRAATVFVHHDAKGVAGDRETRDRGSGSGITGRSVDARITLTPAAADPDDTIVAGFMCRSYVCPAASTWTFSDDAFRPSDLPAEPERMADRRSRTRPKLVQYQVAALKLLESGPLAPSVFKGKLREELSLSKNDADTLTAALCGDDGPARRRIEKGFPPQHYIELKERSSRSSREDRRED